MTFYLIVQYIDHLTGKCYKDFTLFIFQGFIFLFDCAVSKGGKKECYTFNVSFQWCIRYQGKSVWIPIASFKKEKRKKKNSQLISCLRNPCYTGFFALAHTQVLKKKEKKKRSIIANMNQLYFLAVCKRHFTFGLSLITCKGLLAVQVIKDLRIALDSVWWRSFSYCHPAASNLHRGAVYRYKFLSFCTQTQVSSVQRHACFMPLTLSQLDEYKKKPVC